MAALSEQISRYAQSVADLRAASASDFSSAALNTLTARDDVAVQLDDKADSINGADLELLTRADQRLVELAPKHELILGRETLAKWRHSRAPDNKAWWWSLDELAAARTSWPNRILTFFAVVFLTLSIGLVADTFNLLRTVGDNPVTTIGTLTQAALALVAASAFVPAGRKWLIDILSGLGFKNRRFKGAARTLLALAVLSLTLLIRLYLPAQAAEYFHRRGDEYLNQGLVQTAIPAYQQALNLEPHSVLTHLRLAKAEEMTNDHRKAIDNYRSALVLYERLRPNAFDDSYYEAKLGLARLLILHEKDYSAVLSHLAHPEEVIPKFSNQSRKLYTYYWFTYLGWAKVELKYYGEASADLKAALSLHDGAEARFLMGRVFAEREQLEQAREQWMCFIKIIQQEQLKQENSSIRGNELPADWIRHAQERQVQTEGISLSKPPVCSITPDLKTPATPAK